MPETRTVALTDAERVNLLLDENQRLRDELSAAAVLGEVFGREAAATDSLRKIDRAALEIAAANLAPALAANDALRAALKAAEAELASRNEQARVQKQELRSRADALQDERDAARRERHDALVAHHAAEAECEQLRRELAAVRADLGRPSRSFTLGHLIGAAIGTAVVSGVAGVEAVGHVLRGWSW